MYLIWIANQYQVGDVVSQYLIGGSQSAFLGCFGENNALFVAFRAFNDLLY
jgi:hypothetical protein